MKLLQYTKCLKELELYLEADSILNPKLLKELEKDPENLHPDHRIPMEDMSKLDKFWILKEIEEEEESVIAEVEELKERRKEIQEKLTFVVLWFLENKKESEVLAIAKYLKHIKMESMVLDSFIEKCKEWLERKHKILDE